MKATVAMTMVIFLVCSSLGIYKKYESQTMDKSEVKNVLGTQLQSCCIDPMTGFYRDGHCYTGAQDYGTHILCARVTKEFLEYSKEQGNDLMTPLPDRHFPGLKPGDHWCLCISRWLEALEVGVAPPVRLEATHQKALQYTSIEVLKSYSVEARN